MNPSLGPSGADPNDLFPRVQQGDSSAWDDIVATCLPKVRRAVRRRLTSRSMRTIYDSLDLTNDVFTSLAAKWNRYDFPNLNALIAFLTEEATRKVLDHLRKHQTLKRDKDRERPLEAMIGDDGRPFELASGDPTPSQIAQAEETRAWLLSGQSADERRVIELRELGYSNEEIAKDVGWHIRRVQRFVKHLHESWRASGPGAHP